MQILIASSDEAFIARCTEAASASGHSAAPVAESHINPRTAQALDADVLIIDLSVRYDERLAFVRRLRAQGREQPCHILAVIDTRHTDIPELIEAGVDDVIAPPESATTLHHRLQLVGQRMSQRTTHHAFEQKLAEAAACLTSSRDDLHSILNHLRIGTAMTDEDGRLTFLSQPAQRLFETDEARYQGRRWDEIISFKPGDIDILRQQNTLPAKKREKQQFHLRTPGGKYYWIDIEVLDNPNHPGRRIFLFYDMSEVHDLRRQLDDKSHFCDIVGKSKPMFQIYQTINEIAHVDMTALIEGETGTGKELVARAIHSLSHRSSKPFIAVNCGGLTDSLLTSQLFGHKRGAFTGAIEDHKGVFESASGGTLFLDEIGEIPLHVQANMLRVLQEREVTRVGESVPRKIDVRLIAATNRNLTQEVQKGNFRSDLLYRLKVARIHMPALRERREDIPLLVGALINKKRAASGKNVESLSDGAMRALLDYPWPGNVRELENILEYAMLRCKNGIIALQDLPREVTHGDEPAAEHTGSRAITPRDHILDALARSGGNRKEAARLLGMSRATLYRRLSQYGLAQDQ